MATPKRTKAHMAAWIAAAHTPEARAKAERTRKRNLLLKKREERAKEKARASSKPAKAAKKTNGNGHANPGANGHEVPLSAIPVPPRANGKANGHKRIAASFKASRAPRKEVEGELARLREENTLLERLFLLRSRT